MFILTVTPRHVGDIDEQKWLLERTEINQLVSKSKKMGNTIVLDLR